MENGLTEMATTKPIFLVIAEKTYVNVLSKIQINVLKHHWENNILVIVTLKIQWIGKTLAKLPIR